MNNISTRLSLLPRCNLHCLCVQRENERVFERQVEETRCKFSRWDLFNNSDNDERFFGFRIEDIVFREAVAHSDIDISEVISVQTSDWSN